MEERKSILSAWWLWLLVLIVAVAIVFAITKILKKPAPPEEVRPTLEEGVPLPPIPAPPPRTP